MTVGLAMTIAIISDDDMLTIFFLRSRSRCSVQHNGRFKEVPSDEPPSGDAFQIDRQGLSECAFFAPFVLHTDDE
jgi:hypothetical protein